ncbi:hypothetical protein Pla52o_07460 [Novipirellula galeiformis]|uniref:Uncharacterized protein n=1 Tax=Novipirellula galeiformis TaxID=2528004 RepID=A0A5C6CTX4_9BACT|nr:hypothetical protein [Novipirellula galeiformis]TWU26891.1 hypothetical protein Pla52o_07460 [Novipirellula galeiformis]
MTKFVTAHPAEDKNIVTLDRRGISDDRRSGNPDAVVADMIGKPQRKKQRRRHIDPTTCERDYNEQEIEFMQAMDDYKRSAGRMFPTCSEVLEVIRALGYIQLNADQREELCIDEQGSDYFDADSNLETELEDELAGA